MTEYDYSPDAWERYMATQDRIARWVDGTKHAPLCNAFAPATPHLEALALKDKQRRKDRYRRRDYDDEEDSDASIDTEFEQQRQRRRRERRDRPPPTRMGSTWHHERVTPIPERDDFVIVSRPTTPVHQVSLSQQSSPTKPKMSRASPFKPRKAPPPLNLDLAPFPNGVPPQDPYSYRNSGHSSQSSNTTPSTVTPTYTNFPANQLPFPPHTASPAARGAPKPMRSQTMPMQPPAYPALPGYQQAYAVNPATGRTVMVPLRPGMKGYASYGPDPAKTPQLPWSEYTSPLPTSTTKSPSLLKRMFTGITGQKQSRSPPPTPPIPSQQPQYPLYPSQSQYPQKGQYPQSTYPQQQYPMQPQYAQPPYSASPAKSRRKEKDPGTFSSSGKRMYRKRSQSF
ncbi:hypothetical protein BKA70DRAFT_39659 [Coprinopsis sp. MPI-PUGE-AT-0042]|nr:hypothetical protein BKA70DRAFT_39659 [Coprinopsis sp. MPI-PUGE-AT-0042]